MLRSLNLNRYKKHYSQPPPGFTIIDGVLKELSGMRRLLIPLLVIPALIAGAGSSTASRLFNKKLPKDKKALHALNRLTFGPRPGDLEAVRKTGLKKWIEQ